MSNLLKSKSLLGVTVVAVAFAAILLAGAFAFTANAQQAVVSASDIQYAATVQQGSSGQAVMIWQRFLNGYSSANLVNDGAFGPLSAAAAKVWQASRGLVADGVLGPMSRAAAVAQIGGTPSSGGSYPAGCSSSSGYSVTTGMPCSGGSSSVPGCTSTSGYSPTTGEKCDGSTGGGTPSGELSGGAGSITVTALSDYSNEEVGEGQDDVKVLAVEVEADDESDVDVTSVKVEFVQGTAADSEDLTEYAQSVSVWFGGDMVGEADTEDFSENNDVWTKSISLDDAVVRAGDTEDFVVAVTSNNSLDSGDIDTDAWTVDILNVRFTDGDGVVTTEDTDADTLEKTFDFASAATAGDTELKITDGEDDEEVNDAHVIDIHATDETSDVPILSFNLEVEGDLDVNIDQLPVRFTVATQDHVDEMVAGISLWMDGDEISTVSMSTDCVEDGAGCADVGTQETYFFDDMDLDLEAGNDYEFLVKVDLFGDTDLPGDLAPGDTLLAQFSELETDLASFDVTDETGEDLGDGDKTGQAVGSASEVRDVGVNLELVSATAVKTAGDAVATQSDSALFTITFDVTAFGADMYVDATAPDATGGTTESDLTVTPTAGNGGTLTCTITSPTGATLSTSYLVSEDDTERFAITCDARDGAVDLVDGFYDVALANLAYAIDDAQTANLDYTFNLDDYKTPQVFLDDNGS